MAEEWMTMKELYEKCLECRECPLCEGRTNLVFGSGNENADIMLVGEGPGENEDLQGKPFVGRSGKLLDQFLDAVGLDRERDIYIANIVKCRPPENRDPKPEEQDHCIKWLRQQYQMVMPRIVVCLGRIAAQKLIDPDFRVTVDHGKFYKKADALMVGTFHPAAILRNPNNREGAFADWVAISEKIKEIKNR